MTEKEKENLRLKILKSSRRYPDETNYAKSSINKSIKNQDKKEGNKYAK